MSLCTIIMYHYVRPLKSSRYPELKGLDWPLFCQQLDYIQSYYTPITAKDIWDCLYGDRPLPDNACLLTFDDGYLDHYLYVFPELMRRSLSGCFYPPVCAIQQNQVLPVNKIHLLLARNGYSRLPILLHKFQEAYTALPFRDDIPSFEKLYAQYAVAGRFDPPDVIFFKRALQHALPEDIRLILLNNLFSNIMDVDEKILAQEMYLSIDMLRLMARNGMHIGSHGTSHSWMNKIPPGIQKREVDLSLSMLTEIYETKNFFWSMAYPYGGNNKSLHELCAQNNCAFALTTEMHIAEVNIKNRFTLPRFDTNDLLLKKY